jgi:uncharacterized protein YifE (UPF0438 family)
MASPAKKKYCKFDPDTKDAQNRVIDTYSEQILDNKRSNGGRAKNGFIAAILEKDLIKRLGITYDDLRNGVRRREKLEKQRIENESAATVAESLLALARVEETDNVGTC